MPGSRKRIRVAAESHFGYPLSVAAVRATLATRCGDDSPCGAWQAAAAAAGVTGADAFLCHLSLSITTALESLAASAEAARTLLRSRASGKVANDELEVQISSAETVKRVALERELCTVDVALERFRAERGAAAEAASSLSDDDLIACHASVVAGLDASDALLRALPTTVVEIPHVLLVADAPALLEEDALCWRVIAPRAIMPEDLELTYEPFRARAGETLELQLGLRGDLRVIRDRSIVELRVALAAAVEALQIEMRLLVQPEGASPVQQPLKVDIGVDLPYRPISISVVIPASAPAGSSICFGPWTLRGKSVRDACMTETLQVEVRTSLRYSGVSGTPLTLCLFTLRVDSHLVRSSLAPSKQPSFKPGFLPAALRTLASGRRCTAPRPTGLARMPFTRAATGALAYLCL